MGYDTGTQVELEIKQIYPGDTYFKDIGRADGEVWNATQGATYIVQDETKRTIEEGELDMSADFMKLKLRYMGSNEWKVGSNYRILVSIYDSATQYSDTVLEAKFKVR